MKEAAREARIAALPDKVLERIDGARVRWAEAGKECWFQGHLYDVIRKRAVDGTTWLYCLDDEREERLIEGSIDVTRANLDQPAKQTAHSLSISIRDLLCEKPQWIIQPLPANRPPYPSLGVHRPTSRYARIVIPPPKANA